MARAHGITGQARLSLTIALIVRDISVMILIVFQRIDHRVKEDFIIALGIIDDCPGDAPRPGAIQDSN